MASLEGALQPVKPFWLFQNIAPLPPWSHDSRLSTWQPICTYDWLPSAPQSCNRHLYSSLPASPGSHHGSLQTGTVAKRTPSCLWGLVERITLKFFKILKLSALFLLPAEGVLFCAQRGAVLLQQDSDRFLHLTKRVPINAWNGAAILLQAALSTSHQK